MFPELGIGFAGAAFAFGLTVLSMAHAVGHISGGHLNPAVTIGLWVGGRFKSGDMLPYVAAQLVDAVLYLVATDKPGFETAGFASNGYGDLSPGKYGLLSCLVIEVVLTCGFLLVILESTSSRAPSGFAPIAIGLALTLIHLISIPVTNTSVNPARSTGVAQLWLFWLAPLAGAALAGVVGGQLFKEVDQPVPRALSALPEKTPIS